MDQAGRFCVGEKSLVDSSREPLPESVDSPLVGLFVDVDADCWRSSSTIHSASCRHFSESGERGSSGSTGASSGLSIKPLFSLLPTFLETTRLMRCSRNFGFPGAGKEETEKTKINIYRNYSMCMLKYCTLLN